VAHGDTVPVLQHCAISSEENLEVPEPDGQYHYVRQPICSLLFVVPLTLIIAPLTTNHVHAQCLASNAEHAVGTKMALEPTLRNYARKPKY